MTDSTPTTTPDDDERHRRDQISMLYERRAWALDEIATIDANLRALGEEPLG